MKRLFLLFALFAMPVLAGAASTIDTTNQYAWGANMGWTNWRPDFDSTNTEGVIVGEFICSGYVYASNVGWINLGNGFTPSAGHIQYSNSTATDFGVNYTADPTQPGVGILRGFATAPTSAGSISNHKATRASPSSPVTPTQPTADGSTSTI